MTRIFHDISLVHNDILLFIFNNDIFIDDFHCIEITIFFESAQIDFWKTTWTYQFNNLKTV
jgi:hypothetical protein